MHHAIFVQADLCILLNESCPIAMFVQADLRFLLHESCLIEMCLFKRSICIMADSAYSPFGSQEALRDAIDVSSPLARARCSCAMKVRRRTRSESLACKRLSHAASFDEGQYYDSMSL